MFSSSYTLMHALVGGILIGLGSLLTAAATGVPPGISGVLSEILKGQKGEVAWRSIFLTGLIAGAVATFAMFESSTLYRPSHGLAMMAAAGLLVGFGTRLSGGCTSGHGVCGIGLGSKRGIVGTLLFMAGGMGTVYVLNHLMGSPGA